MLQRKSGLPLQWVTLMTWEWWMLMSLLSKSSWTTDPFSSFFSSVGIPSKLPSSQTQGVVAETRVPLLKCDGCWTTENLTLHSYIRGDWTRIRYTQTFIGKTSCYGMGWRVICLTALLVGIFGNEDYHFGHDSPLGGTVKVGTTEYFGWGTTVCAWAHPKQPMRWNTPSLSMTPARETPSQMSSTWISATLIRMNGMGSEACWLPNPSSVCSLGRLVHVVEPLSGIHSQLKSHHSVLLIGAARVAPEHHLRLDGAILVRTLGDS